VLSIRTEEGQEMLPVFSSEEAEIILRLGGVTGGWRARESGAEELISILYSPCAGVKKVVLDPSGPRPVARDGRRGHRWTRFAPSARLHESNHGQKIMSGPLRLEEPEERSSTYHSLQARVRSEE
jgi:hypothetical protein